MTLGDSTAYRTVVHVCSAVSREKLRSFVGVPKFNRSSPYFVRAFKDVHHKYDHVGCRLLGGAERPTTQRSLDLPFGVLTHYGLTNATWWHAYPRPPWLAKTSAAMAQNDAPRFCALTGGCEPTMVVVNSAFWDISGWWAHRWAKNDAATATADQVAEYAAGLRTFVAALHLRLAAAILQLPS